MMSSTLSLTLTDERNELINSIPNDITKVLLHSCCAPCSGSMIKELVDLGISVTVLWYNPNIHPRSEYEIRKQENLKYAIKLGIDFIDLDYDVIEWYKRAKGKYYVYLYAFRIYNIPTYTSHIVTYKSTIHS